MLQIKVNAHLITRLRKLHKIQLGEKFTRPFTTKLKNIYSQMFFATKQTPLMPRFLWPLWKSVQAKWMCPGSVLPPSPQTDTPPLKIFLKGTLGSFIFTQKQIRVTLHAIFKAAEPRAARYSLSRAQRRKTNELFNQNVSQRYLHKIS